MNIFEYLFLGLRYRSDPFYLKYLQNRRILDVGCGRGEFIARDPENIVGIDIDQLLVSQCKARGFTAYFMSALAMDFPDASFDAIHAAQMIEHFTPEDAARFILEAARVLRPGGYILLTTPGVRNVWNTFSHIRPYPPQAFQKLLSSATENYIRDGKFNLQFECAQGYRFYFSNRWPMFLSSIYDLIFPTNNPIGWTIVLKKIKEL